MSDEMINPTLITEKGANPAQYLAWYWWMEKNEKD